MPRHLVLWLAVGTLLGMADARGDTGAPAATLASAVAIAVDEVRPRLDGLFDEPLWGRATSVSGFVQRQPADGLPASFETIVRVAYDGEALWVAVEALDPEPARLVALKTRRDTESPSDWLRVLIDSYRDRRTAYEFGVNPAGVRLDKYWSNDTSEDIGWDAVWDVAVTTASNGWRAEFRIPFSQLRFRGAAPTFGFAVVRQVGRLNEESSWPHLSRTASGYVSSFGELQGLRLEGAVDRFELAPYGVADLTRDTSDDAARRNSGSAVAGLDLKYRMAPGVTLTATVNPDFGQVEADPAEVNLTAFETFFAERRPFFLEGAGTFRFDVDCNDGQCSGLFYSRRIGRPPRGSPELADDERLDAPLQTSLIGATKVTGRARGFSFGLLNAVTSEEVATISGGTRRTLVTEPLASYTVARARREFANQSALGFMLTSTDRQHHADVPTLTDSAVTGGLDWDVRVGRRFAVQGFWAGSRVGGEAGAIDELQRSNVHGFSRPGAESFSVDDTRTTLAGHAAALNVVKLGGERVRFSFSSSFKSPGFDINDLGFQRRADLRTESGWVQFRHDRPTRLTRTIRFNLNQWGQWNYDGDRLGFGGNVNLHFQFVNNWDTGFGITRQARGFDDRLTRGGPGGYGTARTAIWHYVESDDRKRVRGSLNWFREADGHGSVSYQISPRVVVRPTSALELSLGGRFNRTIEDAQWVENLTGPRDRYVFGRLSQNTAVLTTRVNYAIRQNLSVQSYMEPFASAGDYGGFKELVDGRADQYAERYAAMNYTEQPDFTVRSLRATNVLRWEYRPGSTVFLVWQQSRRAEEDVAVSDIGRGLGRVFGAAGQNVLLLKASYWLTF